MESFKVFAVVLFIQCVWAEESLLKPCAYEDIQCLSQSTVQFLEKTSAGIPDYDIKPIDPLLIPSWDMEGNIGVALHLKNVNITGLKNQRMSGFEMNPTAKSVVLVTSTDLVINADVRVVTDKDESTAKSGTYTAETSVKVTAKYNYDLKKDDKGVEHFEVGPETLTCEPLSEVKVTLSPELGEAIANDVEIRRRLKESNIDIVEQRKKYLCKLAEEAYITVIHNIRAAAKVVPKTAFFTNI